MAPGENVAPCLRLSESSSFGKFRDFKAEDPISSLKLAWGLRVIETTIIPKFVMFLLRLIQFSQWSG